MEQLSSGPYGDGKFGVVTQVPLVSSKHDPLVMLKASSAGELLVSEQGSGALHPGCQLALNVQYVALQVYPREDKSGWQAIPRTPAEQATFPL